MIRSTYRVQLHPERGFASLDKDLEYLRDLGIHAVYASPVFEARPGSTHGYDIFDPTRIRGELGGADGFEAVLENARDLGLAWVQDIVPNHMALDSRNPFVRDVLAKGTESRYSGLFAINWEHPDPVFNGRLSLPVLGEPYAEALHSGRLHFEMENGHLVLAYFEHRFPLGPKGVRAILRETLPRLERGEVATLVTRALHLLADARFDQAAQWLAEQCAAKPDLEKALDRTCSEMAVGSRHSIIANEAYAPVWWKTAAVCLNYTRFFSINDLIRVRVEDPDVFQTTHTLLRDLLRRNRVQGLRVDHIDGLRAPKEYLHRLQTLGAGPVWVEKILGPEERLSQDWPIAGSTGYDFLAWTQGVLTDPAGAEAMRDDFARLNGDREPEALAFEAKEQVLYEEFEGDLHNVAAVLRQLAAHFPAGRDMLGSRLENALAAVLAGMPIYRLYGEHETLSGQESVAVDTAVARARDRRPELDNEIMFLESVLRWHGFTEVLPRARRLWRDFWQRFQQLASPLTAKGIEDTLLYRYFPVAASAEVGCEPSAPARTPAAFTDWMQNRVARWPRSMNTTATHDTKRGEDVRARLTALSEFHQEWQQMWPKWRELMEPLCETVGNVRTPDIAEQYFILQTLLGTWPLDHDPDASYTGRLQEYMYKALREAKRHSCWTAPDTEYEATVARFVHRLLEAPEGAPLRDALAPFAARIGFGGMLNGLAQVVLKCTLPGIPDVYQGCEYWDLSLVDPDNRRDVDFDRRRESLAAVRQAVQEDPVQCWWDVCATWTDSRIKQLLLHLCLQTRNRYPDPFVQGEFVSLSVEGEFQDHVLAFLRHYGHTWVLAALPRLPRGVAGAQAWPVGERWGETSIVLPRVTCGEWHCQLTGARHTTGQRLPVQQVFQELPLALWVTEREGGQCPV